jgi:hypothetical protein
MRVEVDRAAGIELGDGDDLMDGAGRPADERVAPMAGRVPVVGAQIGWSLGEGSGAVRSSTVNEVREGLPERIRPLEPRQMAGALDDHHARACDQRGRVR